VKTHEKKKKRQQDVLAKNLISISELMKYIKNAQRIDTNIRNRVVQDIKGILWTEKNKSRNKRIKIMSNEEWEKLTSILPDEMKKRAEIETDMAFQRYKERRRGNALILLFDGIVILIIAIVLVLFNFCQ
jgi:uncharacterized protein YxjI